MSENNYSITLKSLNDTYECAISATQIIINENNYEEKNHKVNNNINAL